MPENTSPLNTKGFKKMTLSQENSVLRARVAELEREVSLYRSDKERFSGNVIELLADSQELYDKVNTRVNELLLRYHAEGRSDVGIQEKAYRWRLLSGRIYNNVTGLTALTYKGMTSDGQPPSSV